MAQLRLSQSAAAERLGLAAPWLRRFLAGDIRRLRTPTIRRISTVLGLPEPVIRLAVLTDEARALIDDMEAALSAARESGYVDLIETAEARIQALQAAPVILPPLPAVTDDDWDSLGERLTQRQKVAILMLVRHDARF
jgi:transcriptional regulator with XRE-family HTH domain